MLMLQKKGSSETKTTIWYQLSTEKMGGVSDIAKFLFGSLYIAGKRYLVLGEHQGSCQKGSKRA